MDALCSERFDCPLGFVEGILCCLGLTLAVVDSAECRLEPFRRGLALLVLALCQLEALPGCRELLVLGWLGQLARPFVKRPGRGKLAGCVPLVVLRVHGIHFWVRRGG